MVEKETLIFIGYIDKFCHFYKDEILGEEPVMDADIDMTDSHAVDNTITDEKELDTIMEMDGNQ